MQGLLQICRIGAVGVAVAAALAGRVNAENSSSAAEQTPAPAKHAVLGLDVHNSDTATQDAQRQELVQTADAFRAGLALAPLGAFDALSDSEKAALLDALGPDPAGRAARLSWFMQSAIARMGGIRGATPVVGFYNPLAEAWLLTRWVRLDGRWKLTQAAWGAGPDAKTAKGPAPWTALNEPWGQAIKEEEARALDAFDREFLLAFVNTLSMRNRQTVAADVYARIDGALGGLATWVHDGERKQAAEAVLGALAAGTTSKLDVETNTGGIDQLPQDLRRSLIPVAQVTEPDGEALVLVSPHDPQRMIVADFDSDHTLRHLALLDFGATETALAADSEATK
jgi:hypothetical protein